MIERHFANNFLLKLCLFIIILCKTRSLKFSGKCKFEEKIKNAAVAGAKGVIVVNNQPDGVVTMSIGGEFYKKKNKIFTAFLRRERRQFGFLDGNSQRWKKYFDNDAAISG